MVNQFNREKINIFIFLSLLFSCLSCALGKTENEVWLGHVSELQIEKTSEHTVLLKVILKEYTKEGTFDSFDESAIVLINREPDLKTWTIILDNVSAAKLKNYNKQDPVADFFLSKLEVSEKTGSYTDPNRTQSKGGRAINSSYIVLTGSQAIHISLKNIDKKNTSYIVLSLEITDKIPANGLSSRKNKYGLEIRVSDFEKDRAANPLIKDNAAKQDISQIQDYIQQLRDLPHGSFRTLVYRVKYGNVSLIKPQLDLLKSEVGQIGIMEHTSQIIIRDRSEYLLSMLELLLTLDIPVPQVMIDIHIIEKTVENNRTFSSHFSYLAESSSRQQGASLGNNIALPLTGENVSGVYNNLSSDKLKNFQAHINAEIRQGKAHLRATTRILCRNRETAKLNSGNSIPYYRMQDVALEHTDMDYRTKETSQSSSYSEVEDTSSSNKTMSNSKNNSLRDYSSDQSQRKINRNWKIEFIQTGVNLQIRPHIKNSEWVEMELKPSYSEMTGLATHTDIPILSNRSLETIVNVKNGSTILLAGLFYEKELKMHKGIPVLMDIPLLGSLFSTSVLQKQQTEIIFILTVQIQSS
ncbi:MAG: hypothetical protein HUU50_20850 [Candidatus Brocadiae bacterium]|nr:hypothetical protein [Candidatus Brocadiia bacterium]